MKGIIASTILAAGMVTAAVIVNTETARSFSDVQETLELMMRRVMLT